MNPMTVSFQTGMSSFIVATQNERGEIELENVGTQPFGNAWSDRRDEVIRNAFDMFRQSIAPFEIEYNAQRAGGIVRARLVVS